jgi:hypothetical protein
MRLDQRVRQLALRREQLVLLSGLQRQSLQLQWHRSTAPLQRAGELMERWRGAVASTAIPVSLAAAAAALPLGWLLMRMTRRTGCSISAVVRLALTAWPLMSSARQWLVRSPQRAGEPEIRP